MPVPYKSTFDRLRAALEPVASGRTIRACLHGSVFRMHPSLVAFLGMLSIRAKQSDVARITTTLFCLEEAEKIERGFSDPSLHARISERYRLIFEMLSGARLILHDRVGFMGTRQLALKNADLEDQEVVEAAVSMFDNTIITTTDGLGQQRLLSSLGIRVLRPQRLILEIQTAAPDIYSDTVTEHSRHYGLTPSDHTDWRKSLGLI